MSYPYPWQNVKDPLALPSGALRHYVQIQQRSAGQDAAGGLAASWTTVWSGMVAIATMSMREVYQMQLVGRVTHRVTLRWVPTPIAQDMQVLFGARQFRIQGVDNVQERNRVLHLLCLEINESQQ